ncbi:MAG TPA: ABC transporter substrate-binding protein, partial [Pseudonocardiaceae bacterium]
LRPAGPALAEVGVRDAVAAALDLADLVAVGSGNGPAVQLATQARTLLPSDPGYASTLPPPSFGVPAMTGNADQAAALLTAAGYERVPRPDGTARWMRGGVPLTLLVAAQEERDAYRTLATRVVRQLNAAGIEAELVTPPGDELFAALTRPPAEPPSTTPATTSRRPATSTPSAAPGEGAPGEGDGGEGDGEQPAADLSAVDIAVVPRPVSGDPAADLASWYGCPGLGGPDDEEDGGAGGPADAAEPENPAGYCNTALQAAMDDLLTGASTLAESLPTIEAVLWRDLPSVPLFQHSVVMVTGRDAGVVEPGPLLGGTLANAPRWRRAAR